MTKVQEAEKPTRTEQVEDMMIRNFPVKLKRRIKVYAAQNDTSMKAVIVSACEAYLGKLVN